MSADIKSENVLTVAPAVATVAPGAHTSVRELRLATALHLEVIAPGAKAVAEATQAMRAAILSIVGGFKRYAGRTEVTAL